MIGLGGLGNFVYRGTSSNNNTLILLGAIPAAILAIVFGAVIDLLQKKVTPRGPAKGGGQMSWDLIFPTPVHRFGGKSAVHRRGTSPGHLGLRVQTARPVILRVVDLLQTIPSPGAAGIIMVVLDPGKLTVIIGITLYSLLPIVRNTCLGLQEVDPGVKEAARGMGMSKPYRVLMVEFPLAFPTVFTGIRIAVVNAIGHRRVRGPLWGGGGPGRRPSPRPSGSRICP